MTIRSTLSRWLKLGAALTAVAAVVALVAVPASADDEPGTPALSMCYVETFYGFDVYSTAATTSSADVVHRQWLETEVIPGELYEMRVVREDVVGPGDTSTHVQPVLGDSNGPYPIGRTYASTATNVETGAEEPFYYRNYHIRFVMDPCR